MRLLDLRLRGIGPFAGEEHIDFTAFEESGLFLLEGPTGAGKSTLIDAIVFALYGDVARAKDASKDRLRSKYLSDSDPAEVIVVFEVPSGIYRVSRTPAYTPSGRKSPRNSQATLVSVCEDSEDASGYRTVEAIASGPSKVGPEIETLIGLKKEQFLQTVVLPQGKFAEFLTSSSDQREQVLRDIFNTHVFADFQKALAKRAAESRGNVSSAQAQVVSAFDVLLAMSPPPTPVTQGSASPHSASSDTDAPTSDDSPVDSGGSANERSPSDPASHADEHSLGDGDAVNPLADDPEDAILFARARGDEARQALSVAHTALDQAKIIAREDEQRLAQGRADADALAEYHRLTSQRCALLERSEDIDRLRRSVADGIRASAVRPLIRGERSASSALDAATHALEHARLAVIDAADSPQEHVDEGSPLSSPLTQVSDAPTVLSFAQARRDGLLTRRSQIAALLDIERELPAKIDALNDLKESARTAQEHADSLTQQLESLPQTIASLTQQVEALRSECAPLDALVLQREDTESKLSLARQADSLETAIADATERAKQAAAALSNANSAAHEAHDLWLRHTAGSLVSSLEDGVPCPVCGSPEHPHPAPLSQQGMTREDVAAFDASRDQAERDFADAQLHLSEVSLRRASLREQAGDHADALVTRLSELNERIDTLTAIRDSIDPLRHTIDNHRGTLEAGTAELTQLTADIAAATAGISRDDKAIAGDIAALSKARGDAPSITAIDTDLAEQSNRLTAVINAIVNWREACERHEDAALQRNSVLAEHGFDPSDNGAQEATELFLDSDTLTAYQHDVDKHDRALHTLTQTLASETMQRAATLTPPDCDALSARAQLSARRRDEAFQRVGALEQFLDDYHRQFERFTRTLDSLAAARAAAGPVRRLSELANASSPENLQNTPLGAWVLISRLDDVLAAANPRLATISSGRYELVSVPDDDTQSRRSGLGLRIIDHNTDAIRSTRTLSGGETFYTSLALALGLADVVTAEAGGIELRTMFIDEGFGSLDSQTLELVMAQLHDLRDSGRTVGVISHVEDMAQQISDQINVRPLAKGGSHLSVRI
ncbi:AAA family ATPase [Schaalia sp. ZJ1691]|uniref:AAA family ATPase n=1 Tax=Schaalia sp. ZJ1691 TaxID=2709404 RepID=UPI0013ECACEF|nr:AAA family ATPase [Schaalia sp. ZJ1691]